MDASLDETSRVLLAARMRCANDAHPWLLQSFALRCGSTLLGKSVKNKKKRLKIAAKSGHAL